MNQEIRKAIREAGVYQWQIAQELDITEGTFIRWLRSKLPEEKKAEILAAIQKVGGEK